MDSNWAKEFDKGNSYWIKVFKILPKNIQEEIMFASPFVSTGIMIWIGAGDCGERKELELRSEYIKFMEEKVYGKVK